MSEEPPPFVAEFNETVKVAEVYICITRDADLQRLACQMLEDKLSQIADEKKAAIGHNNEDYANLLLGCECVTRTLIAELKMWVLLKEEKPDTAWNELINAQMETIHAIKAHRGFRHLERRSQRLLAIEKLVFPPQVFFSSGFLVKLQECSICGSEYEDCEHLVGKPYIGAFCVIIVRDLELDHGAVVKNPADKRCRATHFSVEGGKRNRMTWKVEPEATEN